MDLDQENLKTLTSCPISTVQQSEKEQIINIQTLDTNTDISEAPESVKSEKKSKFSIKNVNVSAEELKRMKGPTKEEMIKGFDKLHMMDALQKYGQQRVFIKRVMPHARVRMNDQWDFLERRSQSQTAAS